MYRISFTNRFKKDARLCKKRGYNTNLLDKVVEELMSNGYVDDKYLPHMLSGDYANHWECHIKPDWLLIWKNVDFDLSVDEKDNEVFNTDFEIILVRTGTHSDLF